MQLAKQMPVIYSKRMVAPAQGCTSPSAAKPELVVEDWLASGLPVRLVDPAPVSVEELCCSHDRAHVEETLALRKQNGFGTISREVAESLPFTSGAMLTGARLALRERTIVAAPCSGFHHAGWDTNGGFCTFNGLTVAALTLLRNREAERIAIVDCDMHFGDGTEAILDHFGSPAGVRHFTAGARWSSPRHAEEFFDVLGEELLSLQGWDVVLYQAGADPHINDPLGGWLTTEQLQRRDAMVFSTLSSIGVPVVWNLAGGYQRDRDGGISPVLEIHRNTALEHLRALRAV